MTRRRRTEKLKLGSDMAATRTSYGPAHVIKMHTHEGAALSIPFGGDFLETFGKRELHIDAHCALYKRPGFAHENMIGERGFDGVLVEISGERHRWIAEAVGPLDENELIRDSHVRALSNSFHGAWDSEAPGRLLILESLVLQLLARFQEQRHRRCKPHWLEDVIGYLHDVFPSRPQLGHLAKRAGVHPVHLAQTFARHHGCSIGAYVERMRVQAVREALEADECSLAQIALETGFSDQSHMSRVFARTVGITPGRFRSLARPKSVQTASKYSRTPRDVP